MTKDDLLDLIVSEVREHLRQPGDISLSDFRNRFFQQTGVRIGEKKGKLLLDREVDSGKLERLVVLDDRTRRDVTVWRQIKPKIAKKKAK